jgi:hypothetical protein
MIHDEDSLAGWLFALIASINEDLSSDGVKKEL